MRFLVTGGSGFIGRHLVRRLARNPRNKVLVLDNLHRSARPEEDHFEFVPGDVRDGALVSEVMRGMDVVFHLAAQSSVIQAVTDLDYSFSTNVVGTYNVLSAARAEGAKKVVFASSREVYGESEQLPVAETRCLNAKNAYGASKIAAEQYCRVFEREGLSVSVVRLANVYGPGDEGRVVPLFIQGALQNEDLVVYGGGQVIDFVWIGCVIEALVRSIHLESSLGPVNIGSGIGTTVKSLAETVLLRVASSSEVVWKEARDSEVQGFVADVRKAKSAGLIEDAGGSLEYLGRVIEFERERRQRAEMAENNAPQRRFQRGMTLRSTA